MEIFDRYSKDTDSFRTRHLFEYNATLVLYKPPSVDGKTRNGIRIRNRYDTAHGSDEPTATTNGSEAKKHKFNAVLVRKNKEQIWLHQSGSLSTVFSSFVRYNDWQHEPRKPLRQHYKRLFKFLQRLADTINGYSSFYNDWPIRASRMQCALTVLDNQQCFQISPNG
jgi:hypothetical protein